MEFACGFVYVPPSVTQRDANRSNPTKLSALLPVNRWRPRHPPPPLPTKSAEAKAPTKSQFYVTVAENPDKAVVKKALLPPHMKNRSPPSSRFTHNLPDETDLKERPSDPSYSYATPEGLRVDMKRPEVSAPFWEPEYLTLLSGPSSDASLASPSAGKEPLPGNPNVLLVSLQKLLSEETGQTTQGEPTFCSTCGAVTDPCYDNVINDCYFCQPSTPSTPRCPQDVLYLLRPDEEALCAADGLLLFCIDTSGSMSIPSQVTEGGQVVHKTRLQFVLEAVLRCVQRLSEQQPDIRLGLVTFNSQVTMHGNENFASQSLSSAELNNCDFLREEAAGFPTPPPLSQNKDYFQRQVMGLRHGGTTALGPAALLTIEIASRQPGSKVILCTDGKANTELGDLELEDNDARTLLSSTIFYQDLGDYAASRGVTVSVLSIEGTDCRLDELGRLAERTGGTVVVASPKRLHSEFEEIIENRMIATHCTVTLLLPRSLHVRGEKEAGPKGTREVGNVDPDTEITFQFGAREQDAAAPAVGNRVFIQLQIRYRQRKGQTMLRVITTSRDVTDDSSAALSTLSLAIIQLNSSQASAALAVRGRLLDARKEGEVQRKLIEKAMEHNHSAEDHQYQEWIKTMEPIYGQKDDITRRECDVLESQAVTDAGAALFYTMMRSNRKTISLKDKQKL
uniref:circularly permutated Ras protein 1-like n=1 Tax=Gasterosteus aculeatus aculeatus TaxID=481459 RepID=UPI001A991967|nr:circularly permutated Ras protein 1-like [Gasterosteus aculeatus aculeatus]XP_040031975.1 circularly permutated Ras protein 1-like [Gasterosteus aculeatus aculeatus]XP_040031976.1 circularly permutated Ras protein 1-like [Gasterosteus aculeatus aculeatus]